MIRCIVINLKDDHDRLDHMSSQFAAIDRGFTRIDAVGRDDAPGHRAFPSLPPFKRPLALEEIGCLLSHYDAWQLIASGSDRYAAVMEDDAVMGSAFPLFHDSDDWIPEDADIVKIDTAREATTISRDYHRVPDRRTLHTLLSLHRSTAGYVISRRAAHYLIDHISHFDEPVDRVLFSPHIVSDRLVVYQMVPALVAQLSHLDEHLDAGRSRIRVARTPLLPHAGDGAPLVRRAARRITDKLRRAYRGQRPVAFRPERRDP